MRVGSEPAVVFSAIKTDRVALTYNLEVADFHSYFVGSSGVWVHNACAFTKYVNLATPKRTRHILYGDKGGGPLWPGQPGKTPFPKNWSGGRVMHEISDVATDPNAVRLPGRGRRTRVLGTRDGVDIEVILESRAKGGGIVTGFPTNLPRNP
jgi:hypothetical protein